MLNILVVDDHLLVRDSVQLILQSEADFNVVAVAATGQQGLDKLNEQHDISLVVTDLDMPGMGGIELINQIRKDYRELPIVVLSALTDQPIIDSAFKSGVNAYVSKVSDSSELIIAIRHAATGKTYLCSHLTSRMLTRIGSSSTKPILVELTLREQEVLKMVASGLTNNEIAEKLFASRRTVEGYRQKLLNKTGTKNTATLIRYAIRYNMVG
jgi:two-component system response regulator NreC